MTWSPKEPLHVIPESVLSALISKSAEIELIGRERIQVTLHEPNDGPAVFREGLVVVSGVPAGLLAGPQPEGHADARGQLVAAGGE